MGSGIAGRRRLPRQIRTDKNAQDDASTLVDEQIRTHSPSGLSDDLISPEPLSDEERRHRWLRDNGALWRDAPERAERHRTKLPEQP